MDLTFLGDFGLSLGGFAAAGTGLFLLVGKLADIQVGKVLADRKAELDKLLIEVKAGFDLDLALKKASFEADLRQKTENILGQESTERAYQLDARRRLYLAVGPLRFQLLQACADFANRVEGIVRGKGEMFAADGYYAKSTQYRLLRILGVCELIERQIAITDFTVDAGMSQLLAFRQAAYECLSSGGVALKHPNLKWKTQTQHLFKDTLGALGSALICKSDGPAERVKRFDEFVAEVDAGTAMGKYPELLSLLDSFQPSSKPILWIRFVALAVLCDRLVQSHGDYVGLKLDKFDISEALKLANDDYISQNTSEYRNAFKQYSNAIKK